MSVVVTCVVLLHIMLIMSVNKQHSSVVWGLDFFLAHGCSVVRHNMSTILLQLFHSQIISSMQMAHKKFVMESSMQMAHKKFVMESFPKEMQLGIAKLFGT